MKIINTFDDLLCLRSSKNFDPDLWNELEDKFSSLYKDLYPDESILNFSLADTGSIVVLEVSDDIFDVFHKIGIDEDPFLYKPDWWTIIQLNEMDFYNLFITFSQRHSVEFYFKAELSNSEVECWLEVFQRK